MFQKSEIRFLKKRTTNTSFLWDHDNGTNPITNEDIYISYLQNADFPVAMLVKLEGTPWNWNPHPVSLKVGPKVEHG